jgi:hypothetical protein
MLVGRLRGRLLRRTPFRKVETEKGRAPASAKNLLGAARKKNIDAPNVTPSLR